MLGLQVLQRRVLQLCCMGLLMHMGIEGVEGEFVLCCACWLGAAASGYLPQEPITHHRCTPSTALLLLLAADAAAGHGPPGCALAAAGPPQLPRSTALLLPSTRCPHLLLPANSYLSAITMNLSWYCSHRSSR